MTGETGCMGRQEVGDRRREMGDRRWKKIDRRRFSDNISEKFSADNLAGELVKLLRTLIAIRKYKLVVAAKCG